ncbi:WD repeat-containing protein 97 isoform X2 [Channa argus]|uniref:WD repeat-containing protein 97 isoform X2 n=1 Tax=Channa argus TaxID=215402 RepID=UPI003522E424
MGAPVEGSRTTTVLLPSPTLRLLPQASKTSNGKMLGKRDLIRQNVKKATAKVPYRKSQQHVLTHGLRHVQHFSCDSPVRFMMYSEAAAAFISLHTDNTACFYQADGHKQTSVAHLPFLGLTPTKISGCLVGWGPGPILTLLDREFQTLDAADNALDIRVCQPAEHSTELVTAGVGNVCVWSVRLMRCKVKIQEGLQHSTFTHMALAPPQSHRPHRAFVVCGRVVTVVDLDVGKVVDHKKDLCSRDITAMVYCAQLDCLIISSQGLSIRVWGPDWELRVAFVGHNGVVTSMFYCSELHMLLSASVDCTICCWNVKEGQMVERIQTERETPPLYIGGTQKGDVFISFSQQGVDFWSIRNLYSPHCKFKGAEGAPLRQILASTSPGPYPVRVLCVSGDSDITLVAAETGTVLTSFKAQQRILCADYCLHKEILLALTEAGTVLQANTLTNPITLMREWKGRGQGPWQQQDCVTEEDAQLLPIPGPACCLVLYSYVPETQAALEEWRKLQHSRGCSSRNMAAVDDSQNRFLIILGQNGGCLSVLKLSNGKVFYRTPAHNGQRITTLQVYPENAYLVSAGEDMTVVVWRVSPSVRECLSQQLSLHYDQPQVYLAALGSQLALTFLEHDSGTYSLMHFNLLNLSKIGLPLIEGHSDHFIGLCVCPDLDVFVSIGLDGTMCIWSEKNDLIRMLQLNAVPECLAYGGFGGELFLGIKGNLYKMNCAQFLPHIYQQMLLYTYAETLPDLPIIESKAKYSRTKSASTARNKGEESPASVNNQLLTEDMWRQKENERIMTLHMDLSALLQGTVKCKKAKPLSTKLTKKESFDRYMKKIYGLPYDIKIDLEDESDQETISFLPEQSVNKFCNYRIPKNYIHSESMLTIPVKKKKKKPETKALEMKSKPKAPVKVKPVEKVIQKKSIQDEEPPVIISPIELPKQKTPFSPPLRLKIPTPLQPREQPPRIFSPIEVPKHKTPPPPHPLRIPTPFPPREPSPEVPTFLKQFADASWFRDVFVDKKSIPSTLTPDDLSLQLLACLNTCTTSSKLNILTSLQALIRQGLLQNIDKLYQGLTDLVPQFVGPHMSSLDQTVLDKMLNLLSSLKSADSDLVKKILTLLAYKELGLRETVLHMLTSLGVEEAEEWLLPQLESWNLELQDEPDIWRSLHDRADRWLESWISIYQENNILHRSVKWKPMMFSMVDVLNYFCSVQKEEYRNTRHVAPPGRRNTMLVPLYDCSSRPIIRLGETYSMARARRYPGIILPPSQHRPFLMHFPNFISFPLTRITLRPFHVYSDEDWLKALQRSYFIPQQSHTDYYR